RKLFEYSFCMGGSEAREMALLTLVQNLATLFSKTAFEIRYRLDFLKKSSKKQDIPYMFR
ncbi:MAG: hypothetical protein ACLFUS_15840, partial [Candidatus Sumerlaeia bacterium]